MGFLHENGIIHGDLCGVSRCRIAALSSHALHLQKNVLISGDGKAFLCGFNLSEFVNVCRSSDVLFLSLKHIPFSQPPIYHALVGLPLKG
jgi:hypothetical protein